MTDTHVRQQVRNRIAALVDNVVGLNVFDSRLHEIGKQELPAAVILFEREVLDNPTKSGNRPGIQRRIIFTSVYAFATSNDKVEDVLDALTLQIEIEIFKDPTLQGLSVQTKLESVESFVRSDPTLPTGCYHMIFSSMVLTKEGSPEKGIQQ